MREVSAAAYRGHVELLPELNLLLDKLILRCRLEALADVEIPYEESCPE
jgi:hypothetical protein